MGHGAGWTFSPGTPSSADRAALQMPVFKSPGDRSSFQGRPGSGVGFGQANPAQSSYDDVGTSYHMNIKWWDQPGMPGYPAHNPGNPVFTQRFDEGVRRTRLATTYDPVGKFVWIHDQTADLVSNFGDNPGEYQDRNRSVMAFLDGRAEYNTMKPLQLYDDVGTGGRHAVGKYTFIFWLPGQGLPPPQ